MALKGSPVNTALCNIQTTYHMEFSTVCRVVLKTPPPNATPGNKAPVKYTASPCKLLAFHRSTSGPYGQAKHKPSVALSFRGHLPQNMQPIPDLDASTFLLSSRHIPSRRTPSTVSFSGAAMAPAAPGVKPFVIIRPGVFVPLPDPPPPPVIHEYFFRPPPKN
ncbi:hypothetical protein B0O99DRAFT_682173 [Bisporella sp. PMI_857]|nr:hypothetical protein B0O99DRAFT_682173 [Bisporella sp. PMI_857]